MMRVALPALLLALSLSGCKAIQSVTTAAGDLAEQEGLITAEQNASAQTVVEAVRKGFEDLTVQEEHFIGRAVAADIVSRYPVLRNEGLERYLNRVGAAVRAHSTRPETWGGYHFAVLDDDSPNAFAAPGGFVLVTRGMIELATTEDELAAVLAHEVGHVAARHGLAAIKKSRLTDAFAVIGQEAGNTLGVAEAAKLADLLDGAVGDIVGTLVERGYSRAQEEEADRLAVATLAAAGYDPSALPGVLGHIDDASTAAIGALRSHPASEDRRRELAAVVASAGSGTDSAPRADRFERALGSLAGS